MYYPPVFINNFINAKLTERGYDMAVAGAQNIIFVPTMPSSIDEMWENVLDSDSLLGIYDRMFRMRRSPFPRIKSEQLLYYLYRPSGSAQKLLEITQEIQDLLDEEDYSAQDVNDWIKSQLNSSGKYVVGDVTFDPVFFNRIRVYQLEEVRDVVDFATARAVFGNKVIIDYDWHAPHSSE